MWRTAMLLLGLVPAVAGGTAAQRTHAQSGDQVRVVTTALRGVYDVVDWSAPTLLVRDRRTEEILPIPVESIRRIDVRTGQEPRGRSFARGLGVGFLVGAAAGAVIGLASGDDPPGLLSFTAEEKALLAGATLGVGGAAVGGVIGASSPRSTWAPVVPPARVALVPPRGRRTGVRVSLSL